MGKITSIASCILLLPSFAEAHGFGKFISTPVTPPLELLWVFPIYIGLFLIGNVLLQRRISATKIFRSVYVTLGFLVCFVVSFFLIGSLAAGRSTGPEPGLGMPRPTFWGFTWKDAGEFFISWNIYGLLILGGWSLIFFRPWRFKDQNRWTIFFGNIVLYLVLLLPFIISGAWFHGWAGGYVHDACEHRLEAINSALIVYADKHDGRFPQADGMDALLKKLTPYLSKELIRYSSVPIDVCPCGAAYERNPKHYMWNASFSGIHLSDLESDLFFEKRVPISCPYHKYMGKMAVNPLIERLLDMRSTKDSEKMSGSSIQ